MTASSNRFRVPLSALDAVHVPLEEQVTEEDTTPPVPDLKATEDRDRETLLRTAAL